ncbi:MAG TPA: hypothetical protein VGK73_09220, partial [Polyangiaceae bacterium]
MLTLFAAPKRRARAPADLAHEFFAVRLALGGDLAKYDRTKAKQFRNWLFTAAHRFFLNHVAHEAGAPRDWRLTVEYDPELHDA